MFLSKDSLRDSDSDEFLSPQDAPFTRQPSSSLSNATNSVYANSQNLPSSSRPLGGSISSNNTSTNSSSTSLNNFDENGQALTPAMRKAKMEELRQQQLAKRQGKSLAQTVVRQEGPKTIHHLHSNNNNTSNHINNANGVHSRPTTPSQSISYPRHSPSGSPHHGQGHGQGHGHGFQSPISTRSSFISDEDNVSRPSTSINYANQNHAFHEEEKEWERGGRGGLHPVEREMLAAGISPIFDPTEGNHHSHNNNHHHHQSTRLSLDQSMNNGLSSHSSPSPSPSPSVQFSVASLSPIQKRLFLVSPTPPQYHHHTYIQRKKSSSFLNTNPIYECIFESGEVFLMAGIKRRVQKVSHYLISTSNTKFEKDCPEYLGKVKSNFVGTEFICYDDGINPNKLKNKNNKDSQKNNNDNNSRPTSPNERKDIRAETVCIQYESNILGSRGPRRMTAILPTIKAPTQSNNSNNSGNTTNNGKILLEPYRPTSDADSIPLAYKKQTLSNGHNNSTTTNNGNSVNLNSPFTCLKNKPPRWNDTVGAYVLNFNGRVTMASVKNFQLVIRGPNDKSGVATPSSTRSPQYGPSGAAGAGGRDRGEADGLVSNYPTDADGEELPILQFGRVGKDVFTMDFGYPLSPLQAFQICLSSFDYKIACE